MPMLKYKFYIINNRVHIRQSHSTKNFFTNVRIAVDLSIIIDHILKISVSIFFNIGISSCYFISSLHSSTIRNNWRIICNDRFISTNFFLLISYRSNESFEKFYHSRSQFIHILIPSFLLIPRN